MSFLHFDLTEFIKIAGYLGVFGFVFAESGLFIGFFLPGDSLLFTAGYLASQGHLNIVWLCVGAFVFAVLGDNVGYSFGKRVGPALFNRPQSKLFNPDHLIKAQTFYEKHGRKTIIIARFMPIIRTFAPIVAGIGNMHYKTFFIYNIIGGFVWGVGVSLLGYTLGSVIPGIDRYILPIILIIIIVPSISAVYQLFKKRNKPL